MSTGLNVYNIHLKWRMIDIFHADVLSWIKKKENIGVKKSNIKYMQNETQNYRIWYYILILHRKYRSQSESFCSWPIRIFSKNIFSTKRAKTHLKIFL